MLTKLISKNADENAFKPLCKRLHLVKLKIGSYKVYYVNQPDGSVDMIRRNETLGNVVVTKSKIKTYANA